MALRELYDDGDESLDPFVVLALVVLSAIMATGVTFAVLITSG
ncbi:MAG TPA: hypothetical protein VFV35_06215 [Acidimicrobiales bacterium]|nr:hypothetical protein [Acidimicrobiales bacterium]